MLAYFTDGHSVSHLCRDFQAQSEFLQDLPGWPCAREREVIGAGSLQCVLQHWLHPWPHGRGAFGWVAWWIPVCRLYHWSGFLGKCWWVGDTSILNTTVCSDFLLLLYIDWSGVFHFDWSCQVPGYFHWCFCATLTERLGPIVCLWRIIGKEKRYYITSKIMFWAAGNLMCIDGEVALLCFQLRQCPIESFH